MPTETNAVETINSAEAKLQEAVEIARNVLDNRKEIERAIRATVQEIEAKTAEHDQAVKEQALEESGIGRTLPSDRPATKKANELGKQIQALTTRKSRLQAALRDREDDIIEAGQQLAEARSSQKEVLVAEFRAEYIMQVEGLATLMKRGLALGDALGARSLSAAMCMSKLLDPADHDVDLLRMTTHRMDSATGRSRQEAAWLDDPDAKATYDTNCEAKDLAEKLDAENRAIQSRRAQEQAEQLTRKRLGLE